MQARNTKSHARRRPDILAATSRKRERTDWTFHSYYYYDYNYYFSFCDGSAPSLIFHAVGCREDVWNPHVCVRSTCEG